MQQCRINNGYNITFPLTIVSAGLNIYLPDITWNLRHKTRQRRSKETVSVIFIHLADTFIQTSYFEFKLHVLSIHVLSGGHITMNDFLLQITDYIFTSHCCSLLIPDIHTSAVFFWNEETKSSECFMGFNPM